MPTQDFKTDAQGFEWTRFENVTGYCVECNKEPRILWACNQNGYEFCAGCLKERL